MIRKIFHYFFWIALLICIYLWTQASDTTSLWTQAPENERFLDYLNSGWTQQDGVEFIIVVQTVGIILTMPDDSYHFLLFRKLVNIIKSHREKLKKEFKE